MNHYIEMAKKETESKIAQIIRDFEFENQMEVNAINFQRQSMCDKSGQKIKTWGICLDCKTNASPAPDPKPKEP